VGDRIKTRYQEQAAATNASFLLKALNIIQKIDFAYRTSNNKRLHLEITLMQIVSINDKAIQTISGQAPQSSAIKKKTTDDKPAAVKAPATSPTTPATTAPDPPQAPPKPAASIPPKKVETHKADQAKPEVRSAPKSFLPGSVSISDETNEEEEETEEVQEFFDADSDEFKNMAEIKPSALEAAWKELLQNIPNDQQQLKSTLAIQKPVATDEFVLEFEVKNPLQQRMVEDYRPEIIPWMRQKLNNRFITLKAIINAEQPADSKPVSPVEKFSHMAAKNPAMIDLQKKFGLEPNY
jgi:DNA polymerase-3 subunit gamma/tau